MERETRFLSGAELRLEGDEKPKIRGYASVFDTPTDIGGMFTERVRPGAFRKTLMESDVRCLWNHDPNYVLGRNKSGTLSMVEDDFGLKVEIDPVDAQWSRDLQASMRRGDVNQMSFAFKTIKEDWDHTANERSLLEVKLFDVSVVTYPAYPQATAQIRSQDITDFDAITGVLFKASRGVTLSNTDRMILQQHIEMIRSYLLPDMAEPGDAHSVPTIEPDGDLVHSIRMLRSQVHKVEIQNIINYFQ